VEITGKGETVRISQKLCLMPSLSARLDTLCYDAVFSCSRLVHLDPAPPWFVAQALQVCLAFMRGTHGLIEGQCILLAVSVSKLDDAGGRRLVGLIVNFDQDTPQVRALRNRCVVNAVWPIRMISLPTLQKWRVGRGFEADLPNRRCSAP